MNTLNISTRHFCCCIFAAVFRHSFSAILILAFTAQTFKGGIIILDYYANIASFTKNCINKAKPKLKCNGNCQMMKRIQEEEKKEQQTPERNTEKQETASSRTFFIVDSVPISKTVVRFETFDLFQVKSKSFSLGVFHPPQFS